MCLKISNVKFDNLIQRQKSKTLYPLHWQFANEESKSPVSDCGNCSYMQFTCIQIYTFIYSSHLYLHGKAFTCRSHAFKFTFSFTVHIYLGRHCWSYLQLTCSSSRIQMRGQSRTIPPIVWYFHASLDRHCTNTNKDSHDPTDCVIFSCIARSSLL